jgi:hypothetical protein
MERARRDFFISIQDSADEETILKKVAKFIRCIAGLLDDRCECPTLQVFVVPGHGNAQLSFIRVFQIVVAAGHVVNVKALPLQDPEHVLGCESG